MKLKELLNKLYKKHKRDPNEFIPPNRIVDDNYIGDSVGIRVNCSETGLELYYLDSGLVDITAAYSYEEIMEFEVVEYITHGKDTYSFYGFGDSIMKDGYSIEVDVK